MASLLIDAYQHRPSEPKTFSRNQDVCLSITSVKRGWEDPLVENHTFTVNKRPGNTSEIPREPNFQEMTLSSLRYKVDKTKLGRDFIGQVIKYNAQLPGTVKDYLVP